MREIALLSTKLRRLSFNFCLSPDQFAELLALRGNPLFRSLLASWFAAFQNTRQSTVVNGLEVLTALALASVDGKLADKAGAVFDVFDFDDSGAITLDELCILLKSAIRGLSKLTKGLGPRFVALCPVAEVGELARQCFRHCDLDEEQDLTRELFVRWVKHTPKIVNLVRCFVQREFLSSDEAAVAIQRCYRGMRGRRVAAELRFEQQLELEHEISQAVRWSRPCVATGGSVAARACLSERPSALYRFCRLRRSTRPSSRARSGATRCGGSRSRSSRTTARCTRSAPTRAATLGTRCSTSRNSSQRRC